MPKLCTDIPDCQTKLHQPSQPMYLGSLHARLTTKHAYRQPAALWETQVQQALSPRNVEAPDCQSGLATKWLVHNIYERFQVAKCC